MDGGSSSSGARGAQGDDDDQDQPARKMMQFADMATVEEIRRHLAPRIQQEEDDDSPFTSKMRDRQARSKNPYIRDEGSNTLDEVEAERKLGTLSPVEPFEEREKRGFLVSVLDSHEQLMMHAHSSRDSVPGQRLRFTAELCGYILPTRRTAPLGKPGR